MLYVTVRQPQRRTPPLHASLRCDIPQAWSPVADGGPDLLSRTARSLVDARCGGARAARRSEAQPPAPRVSSLRAMKELRLDGRLGVVGHGHGKHAAGFCAVRHANC